MDDGNVIFNPGTKDPQNKTAGNVPEASSGDPIPQTVDEGVSAKSSDNTAEASSVTQAGNFSPDPSIPTNTTPEVLSTETGEGGEAPPNDIPPSRSGLWKKIIIGVVLLIIIIFAVFLFLPKGASNKKAKLVWWGLWEDQRVMKSLIDDFQKENPNITVEYVKQDPKQYREKLQTRIKNGTGPDVFRFHNSWVPVLSEELLPLSTDVITPNEFKKTFYPVMQKDLARNGVIYGIPLGADTLGLFVNTELLEAAGIEAPKTWDDFVKAARALTVKDEGKIQTAGAAMGTYGNITHAPDVISLLFIQQGIDIKKFTSSEKEDKVDAMEFYTSFAKTEQNVWDGTLDESIISFSRGSLAIYIGFSWDIFRIQEINKDLPFKTYPVPQLVGREAGLASYWVEGVSAKSHNQKEALQFMQFLAKKETAQKLYTEASKTRSFGQAYARRDLSESLKDNLILYPFVSQLDNAASSYFVSNTNDGEGGINSTSNTYLGNAVNSIIDDNGSSQTAVETLDQGMSQVFQKYGIK